MRIGSEDQTGNLIEFYNKKFIPTCKDLLLEDLPAHIVAAAHEADNVCTFCACTLFFQCTSVDFVHTFCEDRHFLLSVHIGPQMYVPPPQIRSSCLHCVSLTVDKGFRRDDSEDVFLYLPAVRVFDVSAHLCCCEMRQPEGRKILFRRILFRPMCAMAVLTAAAT